MNSFVETYHGHDIQIEYQGHIPSSTYYSTMFSVIKGDKRSDPITCSLDWFTMQDRKIEEPENTLRERGLQWIHGLIDLERFKEGEKHEEYWIEFNKQKSDSWSDEEIREELLKALYRIRKWCISTYDKEYERMDVDGFCNVLDISKDRCQYNANYLVGKGLIQSPDLNIGHIYITSAGIDTVERDINKPRIGFQPLT